MQSNQPEVGGHDGPHREGPLLGPGASHRMPDHHHLVQAQEDPENVTDLADCRVKLKISVCLLAQGGMV